MNTKEIIKYLKTTISEKGEYCYSLSKQTTKAIVKHVEQQQKEIERLNNIINKAIEYINNNFCIENCIDLKELIEILGSDKE